MLVLNGVFELELSDIVMTNDSGANLVYKLTDRKGTLEFLKMMQVDRIYCRTKSFNSKFLATLIWRDVAKALIIYRLYAYPVHSFNPTRNAIKSFPIEVFRNSSQILW